MRGRSVGWSYTHDSGIVFEQPSETSCSAYNGLDSRHSRWCTSLNPIHHIDRVETPTPNAKSLRRQQPA